MQLGQMNYRLDQSPNFGSEDPIVLYEENDLPVNHHTVNHSWLIGIVLTALTSILLVGGALITTFDGRFTLASVTDSEVTKYDINFEPQDRSQKSDRQVNLFTQISDRQTLQINTMKREGNRDLVKVRPFAFVSSTLQTRKAEELIQKIPPFNPVKLSQLKTDEIISYDDGNTLYNAKIEGDVTISVLDFPLNQPVSDTELTFAEAKIEKLIQDEVKLPNNPLIENNGISSIFENVTEVRLTDDISDTSIPKIRIKPENVTFLQKSSKITGLAGLEEVYVLYEEESLLDLLQEYGSSFREAESATRTIREHGEAAIPTLGQKIRFTLAPDEFGRNRPIRVSVYSGSNHKFTTAITDRGRFKKAEAPSATAIIDTIAAEESATLSGPTLTIYQSIYQTALQQDIPDEVIGELVRLYLYDVDFNSTVKPGDKFEILYSLEQEDENQKPEILYTSLTAGERDLSYYRFSTPNSGVVDYYDKDGRSASKFLIRKPITEGYFRSGFGMRIHPILGYRKMHTGVDWAAKRGSQIISAGNGYIEKIGWSAGYGYRIEIRHSDGYLTTYSHLTSFEKSLKRGSIVSQGQLIGFVGSTGLSTGPHLHYEVKINNRFVDPMQINLPRIQELKDENLAKFFHETNQLHEIIESQSSDNKIASRSNAIQRF